MATKQNDKLRIMTTLEEIIAEFQEVDEDYRLELLLDFADKLPPLPERYVALDNPDLNRVPECQTPVYLYFESANGVIHLYADVPPESPTVRGIVSLLIRALNGRPIAEGVNIPPDLIQKLGLAHKIGMMRTNGLSGVIRRIRAESAKLMATHG
jgi:cysteine desulfuration protein SufE